MRRVFAALMLLAIVCFSYGQDGIYGSFIVGQKFIPLQPLNDALAANSIDLGGNPFPNNHFTLGGEGHLLLAERLLLGGKAFGISHERVVANTDPQRRLRVTGGMGVGTLGFSIFRPNRFGVRLYPQVGVGASTFLFQSKEVIEDVSQKQFDTLLVSQDDKIVTLGKLGLIVDVCVGLDWYKPFKNFFTVIPGLELGPMVHVEVGYSFRPGTLKWRRDIDLTGQDQVEGGPELLFNGFYFNVGVGLGLSSKAKTKEEE